MMLIYVGNKVHNLISISRVEVYSFGFLLPGFLLMIPDTIQESHDSSMIGLL